MQLEVAKTKRDRWQTMSIRVDFGLEFGDSWLANVDSIADNMDCRFLQAANFQTGQRATRLPFNFLAVMRRGLVKLRIFGDSSSRPIRWRIQGSPDRPCGRRWRFASGRRSV